MALVDYRKSPDLYAKFYAELNITGTDFIAFRDLPELIKEHVNGQKVLDYGSGAGKSTLYLKSLGLDVNSVDINKEMLKAAKIRDPKGSYQLIDSAVIPAPDCTYDLVFSSWVFMEIGTKKELFSVIQEIHRVLKVGGVMIAVVCSEDTYNTDWLSQNTQFKENENLYSGSTVKIFFKDINLSIYDYFWSEEDYIEGITAAGLKIAKIHKPLGREDDGYHWLNETKKSPCNIYIAKKIN